MHVGDCLALIEAGARFSAESFDFICTDPPYNVHLEQTMSNRPALRRRHANRRTDYDMRSEAEADLANLDGYATYLDAMEGVLRACYRVLRGGSTSP